MYQHLKTRDVRLKDSGSEELVKGCVIFKTNFPLICLCFGFLTNAVCRKVHCMPSFECHISRDWNVVKRALK